MTRPRVLHEGFIVPNAGAVTNPRMAEPDQIDFNSMAHALWGVVEGCLVTVAGSTATVAPGIAVVNGLLVTVPGGSTDLQSGGTDDRFYLVGVNQAGAVTRIAGTAAVDPYFPDPPLEFTTLAAVFASAGAADFSSNVIDKRKFVHKALLTKIGTSADLIRNLNGGGDSFRVDGGGKTTWLGDTALYRSAPKTLTLEDNLIAKGFIQALTQVIAETISANGLVSGRNLQHSALPGRPDSQNGDLLESPNGRLYIRRNNAWVELASLDATAPVGALMTSVETEAVMLANGWLAVKGQTISENDFPSLFTLAALASYITGTSPNRQMTLPNASGRLLMVDFTKPATLGGSTTVTLQPAHIPRHKHNVAMSPVLANPGTVTITPVGPHNHFVNPDTGHHGHEVTDHLHTHDGMEFFGQTAPIIAVVWGGTNKIDALFNDRNHTYSVEALRGTRPSRANIEILQYHGTHNHQVYLGGDHGHSASLTGATKHDHPVTEDFFGDGQPVALNPPHLTCNLYIRT